MFSCAWIWMYVGAFLMLAELLAPGFVIFFFGLSAATVGLVRFVFGEVFTLTGQLAAFSAFSIIYLVVLRRLVKRIFAGQVIESATNLGNESVGRVGKVTQAIKPPLPGRVMIGDAEWNALAEAEIPVGTDIRVVAQENLTMRVAAIGA